MFQAEVMVGLDEGQGLVDGGIAPGRRERVLQAVAVRGVIVNVVGGNQGRARACGQCGQLPVAGRVLFEEILLEFHVHPARPVTVLVLPQQPVGVLAVAF